MQLCLLDMVQDILSDMNSDEVNSIQDTIEALQVAQIVKTCYFKMCSNRDWGDEKRLLNLEHIGEVEKPNYLKLPVRLKRLDYLAYDISKDPNVPTQPEGEYRRLQYRHPDEFLRIVHTRPYNKDNYITVTDFGGAKLFIKTDEPPTYWTSFDDTHLITDSYDAGQSNTLVASRTSALAVLAPTWEQTDTFIPKLPIQGYSALLAEAKKVAFLSLRQMENVVAAVDAQKQQAWLSRHNQRHNQDIRYVAYGRQRRK